ncbi:hypothetical protein PVK06_011787 [Gossypium arboreum]|uniref:Uncharacterized protein n=1 Tax=Gossypium arboreum TaxID=29729 RepID=A0ABR0QAK9_GOSAR|nr:hypothetical protein PVK06_011787 [Gossypium arboreum]
MGCVGHTGMWAHMGRPTRACEPSFTNLFAKVARVTQVIYEPTVGLVNPSSELQFQYLPKVRQFTLVGKGNVLNGPSSPMPKGKQGMGFEVFQSHEHHLIVDENIIDDLVLAKQLYFDAIGSNYVKCDNQGPCVEERFVAIKWPDLRTNHFKKGGYDTNTPWERPWFSSSSIVCNILQADLARSNSMELNSARC